jgi:hypothetical protein
LLSNSGEVDFDNKFLQQSRLVKGSGAILSQSQARARHRYTKALDIGKHAVRRRGSATGFHGMVTDAGAHSL